MERALCEPYRFSSQPFAIQFAHYSLITVRAPHSLALWGFALTVMLAAFGFRTLNTATWACKPTSVYQGHAMWHVGASLSITTFYLFLRAEHNNPNVLPEAKRPSSEEVRATKHHRSHPSPPKAKRQRHTADRRSPTPLLLVASLLVTNTSPTQYVECTQIDIANTASQI